MGFTFSNRVPLQKGDKFSLDPLIHAQRLASYQQIQRAFEAGKQSRRTEGWDSLSLVNGGPNSDIRLVLDRMVRRHQDMIDSDPWASKAINVIQNNWVGDGIVGNPIGGSARFKDGYREWAESTLCDFYGNQNFYGIQSLVARTTAARGSCLVRFRLNEDLLRYGLVPLQLQTLEPDYLDFSKDNGLNIRFGKEYDQAGRLQAYWIRRAHPGERDWTGNTIISDRISAEEICHVYEVRRPGQAIGVPFGVSALLKLRDVSDRDAAQLMKDKLAACFMAFVTDPSIEVAQGQQLDPSTGLAFPLLDKLQPGAIEILGDGRSVTFANPPSSGDFSTTQKYHLLSIATAYEITYESLTGDYSQVNFSSARMGRMEMRQSVSRWRWSILIPQLLKRVEQRYKQTSMMTGVQRTSRSFEWTPPVAWLVDPAREIPAYVDAIRAGMMSLSEVQRMLGYVPSAVLKELGEDMKAARDAGLKLDVDLASTTGTVRPVTMEPPAP